MTDKIIRGKSDDYNKRFKALNKLKDLAYERNQATVPPKYCRTIYYGKEHTWSGTIYPFPTVLNAQTPFQIPTHKRSEDCRCSALQIKEVCVQAELFGFKPRLSDGLIARLVVFWWDHDQHQPLPLVLSQLSGFEIKSNEDYIKLLNRSSCAEIMYDQEQQLTTPDEETKLLNFNFGLKRALDGQLTGVSRSAIQERQIKLGHVELWGVFLVSCIGDDSYVNLPGRVKYSTKYCDLDIKTSN